MFAMVNTGNPAVLTSSNGINWKVRSVNNLSVWGGASICWSKELGIFLAVGSHYIGIISSNGIDWSVVQINIRTDFYVSVSWSPQLGIFVGFAADRWIATSSNGINWTERSFDRNITYFQTSCWSPELGIFVVAGSTGWVYSSLKGRPPTSYNVFDSSFNRIDETGKWTFENIDISTNLNPVITKTGTLGSSSKIWGNAYIQNLTLSNRAYQNISGGINDLSWSAVNGYYALAKDEYPALNPLSNGVLAVSSWNTRVIEDCDWRSICWSPKLRLFAAVARHGNNRVMISNNGINWTFIYIPFTSLPSSWEYICWSPELEIFVAVAFYGDNRIMTSSNGTQWNIITGSNVIGDWRVICWSTQLGLFVVIGWSTNIITSSDGTNWTLRTGHNKLWTGICWAPEISLFVAVGEGSSVMTSNNGINWNLITSGIPLTVIQDVCWSPELGIFVAIAYGGTFRVMTSNDGINWTSRTQGVASYDWYAVSWSPQLNIFVAVGYFGESMYSNNGINWNFVTVPNTPTYMPTLCWSPELGIFVGVGYGRLMTSSLKGRPPTSYNVFDSSYNNIDTTGKWTFINVATTTLTVNGSNVTSDDRVKHNEAIITNGLTIIDQLTPKFYQKTLTMLDASYNGDLSGITWNYEAGLIAQELLHVNDISYVVSGGDYYQESYKLIRQTNETSNNLIPQSYDPSSNYYEISHNLITQAYTVNYNSIFVYGLAAIKELHTKVKAQETIISSLIARIESLENSSQI
jgi:hypothetical protein